MQTQFQQGNKKNKVLVPFYTPPSRLYGPTPSEIIKEAREAVMPPPSLGIKPVFTTRPFTPKDNERTLFSSFKKKNRRQQPVSEKNYNLSLIKNADTSNQVKLPSIESIPKKKSHSIFYFSNNLSLDNLVEDCDAEALEEDIDKMKTDKLPSWKKSHSCPKEGRMVKAALYNELNHKLFSERNSTWDTAFKDKNDKVLPKSGSELHKKNIREKSRKQSLSTIFNAVIASETTVNKKEFNSLLETAKNGGHNDPTFILDPKNLLNESHLENAFQYQVSDHTPSDRGDYAFKPHCLSSSEVDKTEFDKLCSPLNITEHSAKFDHVFMEVQGIEKETKVQTDKTSESKTNSSNNKTEFHSEEPKSTSLKFSDKSIATCSKSEYLSREKKETSYDKKEPCDSLPQEILELYQTIEYYGVSLENNYSPKQLEENGNSNGIKLELCDVKGLESPTKNKVPTELDTNVESKEKEFKNISSSLNLPTTPKESYVQAVMSDKKRNANGEEKKKRIEKTYEKWIGKKELKDSPVTDTKSQGNWDFFWKNCYYETKKEEDLTKKEIDNNLENPNVLETLMHLINKLTGLFKLGSDSSTIYDINCELYHLLKNNQDSVDSAIKDKILKTVTLHSENEDPRVLLSIARILFYLKLDSSLTTACKMIFNVARFDENDNLFLCDKDILELFMEGVGRASPLDYAESCIYGYGALKFLTMNHNILSRTLHMGALDLMTLHLKLINTAFVENGGVEEQTQHALFQLTGVLRHIAAGDGALPLFITTNCVSVICKNLELFQEDEDIVTNISRTLSLISTDESITQVLMSVENILPLVVDLMECYKENDKILIRLSFCLGNIVEHSDLARIQLLRSDSSLSILLNLLKFYIDKELEVSRNQSLGATVGDIDLEVVDDIIVKVIRVIANMSMNPIVGSNLAPVANEKSLQLSQLLSELLLRKDSGMTLLATLGCLNNVSYYCNSHSALIGITQGIERVLGLQSEDCQAEAARVLGNLTRHKEIRHLIFNTGGVDKLIKLLTSKDQEVLRCACGALVNVLLDSESRKRFLEAGGIDKLVDAMELFSGDWSLASLAGRAIWNSCADDMSSAAMHNNLEHILNSLVNCLEEENWKDGDVAWEEFASIATDLLEKINSHLDSSQ